MGTQNAAIGVIQVGKIIHQGIFGQLESLGAKFVVQFVETDQGGRIGEQVFDQMFEQGAVGDAEAIDDVAVDHQVQVIAENAPFDVIALAESFGKTAMDQIMFEVVLDQAETVGRMEVDVDATIVTQIFAERKRKDLVGDGSSPQAGGQFAAEQPS